MTKALHVLALLIGIPVVLLAAAVAAGLYLNQRAEADAGTFCSSINVGMPEADAVALGQASTRRHSQSGNEHRFFFQGWVFNGSECIVRVEAGKVVAAKASIVDD